ncbi:hypothetical protein L208DRAFT_1401058 [Tricholoma matsutake]|nr:hypothetical protein L208DRAFT_1401058 [Tricholoma matsutake 945]
MSKLPPGPVLLPPSLISPPSSHIPPSSTLVPACFDWADNATPLPTAPSTQLRDLSDLKVGHMQPFRTLQRHTQQ